MFSLPTRLASFRSSVLSRVIFSSSVASFDFMSLGRLVLADV